MESPDTPWAKEHDVRIKKKFTAMPSHAVLFFYEFLKSKQIERGRLADLGCGNGRNAVYFANHGFEVHAIDKSGELLIDLDLHAVTPHCHSITGYWLFEDNFFDLAIDVLCYSGLKSESEKEVYLGELARTLALGGYYLLSVPYESARQKIQVAHKFFSFGFKVIKSEKGNDTLQGNSIETLNFIMQNTRNMK